MNETSENSYSNRVIIYKIRDPTYWGPSFWNFLYLTILGMPITFSPLQSREVSNLIQNFHLFLPCHKCRFHYANMVKDLDIQVSTRGEALEIISFLHNQVRKRLKKTPINISNVLAMNEEKLKAHNSIIFQLLTFIITKLTSI